MSQRPKVGRIHPETPGTVGYDTALLHVLGESPCLRLTPGYRLQISHFAACWWERRSPALALIGMVIIGTLLGAFSFFSFKSIIHNE